MKKKLLFCLMLTAIFSSCAMADLFIGDAAELDAVWRYSLDGKEVWETAGGNASSFLLTPDRSVLFVCKQGVGTLAMQNYDAISGTNYADNFMLGTHCVSAAWGHDYDGDGKDDMFIASRDQIRVVDVNVIAADDVNYTVLATWSLDDDSNTSNLEGIGGHILVGPDMNNDGIGDIFQIEGTNSSNNTLMIIDADAATGDANVIASYAMPSLRSGKARMFGPDQNGDGEDDIWVASQYNDLIAAIDVNGTYIGAVDINDLTVDNPLDIVECPNGDIYIATRFGSSLGSDSSVVKYVPSTGEASNFIEDANAYFGVLAYTPNQYDFVVSDTNNATLTRYDSYGDIVWQKSYGRLNDLSIGPDGAIWAAYYVNNSNNNIRRYSCAGVNIGTYVDQDNGGRCNRFVFGRDYDSDGHEDLFISGSTGTYPVRVHSGPGSDNEGELLDYYARTSSGSGEIDNGGAMAWGPDIGGPNSVLTPDGIDDLYILDSANDSSGEIHVLDGATLSLLQSTAAPGLRSGSDIAFGSDGKIYVTSHYNDSIYRYDANCSNETVWVTDGINNPTGLVFAEGDLYVSNRFTSDKSDIYTEDTLNAAIQRYDASTGEFQSIFVEEAGAYMSAICAMPTEYEVDFTPDYTPNSISELMYYLDMNDVNVVMEPGDYYITLDDVLSGDITSEKMLEFSGDNSNYDFNGVTFYVDTELLHSFGNVKVNTVYVSGSYNHIFGLTIRNVGDEYPYDSATEMVVFGDYNVIEEVNLYVRGSYPYAYGDMFGKGITYVIKHFKHSSLRVNGIGNHLLNCYIDTQAYGHGIYMQGSIDTLVEGCYVKGYTRTTDEVLAETSGPAYDADFMTIWGWTVPAGYTFSLSEDGIRCYNEGDSSEGTRNTETTTVKNCTVENMRGGVTIGFSDGVNYVSGCTVIGGENAYWTGNDDTIENCQGEAPYDTLVSNAYATDNDQTISLTVLRLTDVNGAEQLAYLGGSGHDVTFLNSGIQPRPYEQTIQMAGKRTGLRFVEFRDGYDQFSLSGTTVTNWTDQPVVLDVNSSNCDVSSYGTITDYGTSNSTSSISPCTATASGGSPYNSVDANTGTYWLDSDIGDWIKYDLGQTRNLHKVLITWQDGAGQKYDFDIKVASSSSGPWTTVYSGTSSGASNFDEYAFPTVYARYVMIVGYGNDIDNKIRIQELDIDLKDRFAMVKATSEDGTNVCQNTVDGDFDTCWSAEGDGHWIQYDLLETKTLSAISIAWKYGDSNEADFDIAVSDANANGPWTIVDSNTSSGTTLELEPFYFEDVNAQYVRIICYGDDVSSWNHISEVFIGDSDANELPDWTQIIYDDFESDFGNWTDGGDDCLRYTGGTYAYKNSCAIDLQDDTSTSVMSTSNLALSSYDEVKVDFAYYCVSMDNSAEDFWLQISTNGGTNYTTVEEWNLNDEFVNGQFYTDSVTITGYTLTDQTRIRFRCDASGNKDDVYIDDVTVSAQ